MNLDGVSGKIHTGNNIELSEEFKLAQKELQEAAGKMSGKPVSRFTGSKNNVGKLAKKILNSPDQRRLKKASKNFEKAFNKEFSKNIKNPEVLKLLSEQNTVTLKLLENLSEKKSISDSSTYANIYGQNQKIENIVFLEEISAPKESDFKPPEGATEKDQKIIIELCNQLEEIQTTEKTFFNDMNALSGLEYTKDNGLPCSFLEKVIDLNIVEKNSNEERIILKAQTLLEKASKQSSQFYSKLNCPEGEAKETIENSLNYIEEEYSDYSETLKEYTSIYTSLRSSLSQLNKNNESFRELAGEFKTKNTKGKQQKNYTDFLVAPVQRAPRHEMFVKGMIKETSKGSDPLKAELSTINQKSVAALEVVQNGVAKINDSL
jgi:hypothetical protein